MVSKTSVGVDYHKDSLQVCVMNTEGDIKLNRRISNNVGELISLLGVNDSVVVAAEACNGSASFLDEVHQKTGWQVKLCHPGYAQRMRSNPDKTDKGDSELIADLTRIGYLPEVWLAPKELRDLKTLVRYRASRMTEARVVKVRIKALLRNNRIEYRSNIWTRVGLQWLEAVELPSHSAWVMRRYLCEFFRLKDEVIERDRNNYRGINESGDRNVYEV